MWISSSVCSRLALSCTLLGRGKDAFYERFKLVDIFVGVALIDAKEDSCERGGDVESVVYQEQEESIFEGKLKGVSCAHFVFSGFLFFLRHFKSFFLVFLVVCLCLDVEGVEF